MKTERTYYVVFAAYMGLASAIFPIYPLFLLSRGLDLFQINVVLAVYFGVVFLFEVPTGAIADLYGRKASFLLACATRCTAFLLYAFADGFLDCVIAEFIDAVGTTLASGSLEAWAVDGMRGEGDRRPTDRVFARAHLISRVVGVGSGVVGGYLADADLRLPWLLAGSGYAVTGILAAVLMRESRPARPRLADLRSSLGRQLTDGLSAARGSPLVAAVCLLTLLGAFAYMPINLTWPPRLHGLSGQGYWLIGWIWALISLAGAAGTALTTRLLRGRSREQLLFGAQLVRAAAIALAGAATAFFPALGGLLLAELAYMVGSPTLEAWLNEHIESERRATVLSVWGMSFTLGGGLGCLALGLIANATSIATIWLIGAAIFALTAPAFLRLRRFAGPRSGSDRDRSRGSAP